MQILSFVANELKGIDQFLQDKIYPITNTPRFHTVETVSRFVLPLMEAFQKWGGLHIQNPLAKLTLDGLEWSKELNCSGHFFTNYYKAQIKGDKKGVWKNISKIWDKESKESWLPSLLDISASLGLLAHGCATMKYMKLQSHAGQFLMPFIDLSTHFKTISTKIGNSPIYQSLLAENFKPLKDKLYTASVAFYLLNIPKEIWNGGLENYEEREAEFYLDTISKIAKLVATIYGGKVFQNVKDNNLSLAGALTAGTIGFCKLAYPKLQELHAWAYSNKN